MPATEELKRSQMTWAFQAMYFDKLPTLKLFIYVCLLLNFETLPQHFSISKQNQNFL